MTLRVLRHWSPEGTAGSAAPRRLHWRSGGRTWCSPGVMPRAATRWLLRYARGADPATSWRLISAMRPAPGSWPSRRSSTAAGTSTSSLTTPGFARRRPDPDHHGGGVRRDLRHQRQGAVLPGGRAGAADGRARLRGDRQHHHHGRGLRPAGPGRLRVQPGRARAPHQVVGGRVWPERGPGRRGDAPRPTVRTPSR